MLALLVTEKLWWHGTWWLPEQECEWRKTDENINTSKARKKKFTIILVEWSAKCYGIADPDLSWPSKSGKLFKVTAYVERLISLFESALKRTRES